LRLCLGLLLLLGLDVWILLLNHVYVGCDLCHFSGLSYLGRLGDFAVLRLLLTWSCLLWLDLDCFLL